jgi:hypothetical protein
VARRLDRPEIGAEKLARAGQVRHAQRPTDLPHDTPAKALFSRSDGTRATAASGSTTRSASPA